MMVLFGPFVQLLTLNNLPERGKISDEELEIIPQGGILTQDGMIKKVGDFQSLKESFPEAEIVSFSEEEVVALPAYTDCHTHICYGGNRANDFAMRNSGKTYLEIAQSGGGIWSSVEQTRKKSEEILLAGLLQRIDNLIKQGITTIEIKSGYGLDFDNEIKMLRVIKKANEITPATLIPTCLAAHLKPKDFSGTNEEYLNFIVEKILPVVKEENLSQRVDIFIEKSAFAPKESLDFLKKAKEMGFEITAHCDQFTPNSSQIAVKMGALSADHLEYSDENDIECLANSSTVSVVLPGASLGLGEPFAPARKLLDKGAILAIATDFNPGSAPMGELMIQASILATYQKLTTAEVFAGITQRANKALNLSDRGVIKEGKKADFILYKTKNYQNILYKQGGLQPYKVYINAEEYQ